MKQQYSLLCISIFVIGFLLPSIPFAYGAKILSVAFMSAKSHKITYDLLLQELANRGHEVTVLSPIPSTHNRTNPREILTIDMDTYLDKFPDFFGMSVRGEVANPFTTMVSLYVETCRATYALPQVKELLNQKFDLVLHEAFLNECAAGYLYKLNTTLILLSPFSVPSELMRLLGGPAPPSFIPNIFSPFDNKMNFVERMKNFLVEIVVSLTQHYYFVPIMEALYREALNDSAIPDLQDIIKNSSLILSNSHISLSGARPFMPDIIEVGGMHMREAKSLPKDLEEFATSSGEYGFIFFSMGTILQSSSMPAAQAKALIGAFSKLKQKVLWKLETDTMPELPSNVKLIKWAPQQDILGHPKIRAFITHGGLGSVTEAIYHGVPFVGIPVFGDQQTNVDKFVRIDIARYLNFATLTEDGIVEAVQALINDPKYHNNVRRLSNIFKDQRDNPLERAVFWTEYVLRHNGAVHSRSPSRDLNFFQYHSVDVIATLITVIFLFLYIMYNITRIFFQRCLRRSLNPFPVNKKYN